MSIDLNAASFEELSRLPGVGPQRARQLALWRPYLTWDQVASIPGFDDVDVEALRAFGVVLGEPVDAAWVLRDGR
jgi:DNA uptake protein ComE-like DNA-binding protein